MSHIMLSKLRAADILPPEAPGPESVKVVRDRDLEGFEVSSGRDGGRRVHYTVRNANIWPGYRFAVSIRELRALIEKAS